ncbi:hypothetical protein QVD17_03607 [Tagetes erecta]|uniref:Uncharacterized protein n=1 Tax=Tagetes erecta TaxID=13708 RepID=A0AAD8P9V0_TARER|nr:hypothetical protein QVD17_03607 [Tagetes erecta]
MELFECLPKIEHLTFLDSFMGALLVASVPEEVPTLLTHLKYACVDEMYVDRNGLTFLGVLIKCSPNLEKLKIIPHDGSGGKMNENEFSDKRQ